MRAGWLGSACRCRGGGLLEEVGAAGEDPGDAAAREPVLVGAVPALRHPYAATSIELGRLGPEAVALGAATIPMESFLNGPRSGG